MFCAAWCEDNETLAFTHVHTDAPGSRASTVDTLVVTTVTDLSENFARRTGSASRLQPPSKSVDVAAIGRRSLRGHEDAVLCCVFAVLCSAVRCAVLCAVLCCAVLCSTLLVTNTRSQDTSKETTPQKNPPYNIL